MKEYCVISHTHWDREWYRTQEKFRIQLVDLFDHLLEILDSEPDYIFHMDAQTIVFEDYWEIRPEMKEKCCKYIQEGRILAGPWYVQNDFFLTSGEATVRNLLLGMKQANDMGRCGTTGYVPDQFGLISQLPQILRGFELDHCIFGRGYGDFYMDTDGVAKAHKKPSEFLWKGADGSEVLAIHMTHWYNNAQRFSEDIGRASRMVENIRNSFDGIAVTPYLLLMNGVDHLEPQGNLLPILNEVQKALPKDEKIYQTSLEHYVDLVKKATAETEMHVETGELMAGMNKHTLKDTTSSRIYLKIMNTRLQNMLENCLEPLYALLEMSGMDGVYPSGHLDYMWKMLIRNHAHDSICGCSHDAVHRHMEDRFAAIEEVGEEMKVRGMRQLAAHAKKGFDQDDYQIVVFNALEKPRTETIDVAVDIVASDEPTELCITDPSGKEIPYRLLKQYTFNKSVFSPINLPGNLDTVRYEIRMMAENVPGFGYKVYRVQTRKEASVSCESVNIVEKQEANCVLENQYLKAEILPSGTVNLWHKDSGNTYQDILNVQDIADIGNAYIFTPLAGDTPITLREFTPTISVEQSDAWTGKVRIHYDMEIPAYYDVIHKKRSDETVSLPIDIYISLNKEDKYLGVDFEVDNHGQDHRLQAFVRTGIVSDVVTALSPYDLITRNKWDIDTALCNETEHSSGMVTIAKDELGISALTRGIYDYENLQREDGTLTFTLVRSTGTISGGVESDDEAWKIPENQCLRTIRCELALLPQQGKNLAEKAIFAAKSFQNPLLVQCEPVDTRKFLGGRPAVQDSSVAELFYQDIPYADVKLELNGSELMVKGDGLQVTALKKSFDRTGHILRFYNAKDESVDAVIDFGKLCVSSVWKTNLKETKRELLELKERQMHLSVGTKEIVTLYLMCERIK